MRQSGPAGRRSRPSSTSSSNSLDDTLTLLGIAQSKKRKLNHHDNELFIEESNLLKKLAPHENIIKFVEVIEDVEYNDSIFIGNKNLN